MAPAAIEALGGGIAEPFFMSVGFFETHRSFFAPSSVRDRVYSLPPPFLPDTPEIRQDVAAYKASARSLDHGVGSVLNTLHETGMDRNTLVICTTDHGLAFPTAKASLLDRGIGVMLIMRGPGMPPGVAHDELVSQIDLFPTICEVAGIDPPEWLQGRSLVDLVSGTEAPGTRSEIFSELTYHAAYEPQRAIRTERFKYVRRFDDYPYPVLANCDDSPSKDAYLARGWGKRHGRAGVAARSVLQPRRGAQRDQRPRLRACRLRPAQPGGALDGGDRLTHCLTDRFPRLRAR